MATLILNATQLQAMEDDLTADYELGNDILAGATRDWNGGLGFDPIGDSDTPFTGSFDGKGYTINDLFINRPTEDFVGLFGDTDGSVIIRNVGVVDCDITGDDYVGALVGRNDYPAGTISKCFSSGSITGGNEIIGGLVGVTYGDMEDCYSTCTVTVIGGTSDVSAVGGLVASLGAVTVTRCYATGNVIVTSDGDIQNVGGFLGEDSVATITKCYAMGDVSVTAGDRAREIGGFVGTYLSNYPISNCYARGNVTVSVADTTRGDIGGFVGQVGAVASVIDDCYSTGLLTVTALVPDVGGFCGDNYGTITNCFWDTQTSGTEDSDGGTGKTTAQMKTKATFTDAGWDFDTIWHITTNRNNGYPILRPPGFGHYWVEGGKWTFVGELGKQQILGTDTTADAIAGHFFVEGDYFHYLDSSGNERRQKGKLTGAMGVAGHYWIDDLRWRYIDSSGNERYLGTWILGQSKLGVDTILHD